MTNARRQTTSSSTVVRGPNGHRFYFVMEAESFEDVTGALNSPFLEDHDGHIAPVLTFDEVAETILE